MVLVFFMILMVGIIIFLETGKEESPCNILKERWGANSLPRK